MFWKYFIQLGESRSRKLDALKARKRDLKDAEGPPKSPLQIQEQAASEVQENVVLPDGGQPVTLKFYKTTFSPKFKQSVKLKNKREEKVIVAKEAMFYISKPEQEANFRHQQGTAYHIPVLSGRRPPLPGPPPPPLPLSPPIRPPPHQGQLRSPRRPSHPKQRQQRRNRRQRKQRKPGGRRRNLKERLSERLRKVSLF
jgi:hypothetical protein